MLRETVKELKNKVFDDMEKVERYVDMKGNIYNCFSEFLDLAEDSFLNKEKINDSIIEMKNFILIKIKNVRIDILNLCDLYKTYLCDRYSEKIVDRITYISEDMKRRYVNRYNLSDSEIITLLFMKYLYTCDGDYTLNFTLNKFNRNEDENKNEKNGLNVKSIVIEMKGKYNFYNFCNKVIDIENLYNFYNLNNKITIENAYIEIIDNHLIVHQIYRGNIRRLIFSVVTNFSIY